MKCLDFPSNLTGCDWDTGVRSAVVVVVALHVQHPEHNPGVGRVCQYYRTINKDPFGGDTTLALQLRDLPGSAENGWFGRK